LFLFDDAPNWPRALRAFCFDGGLVNFSPAAGAHCAISAISFLTRLNAASRAPRLVDPGTRRARVRRRMGEGLGGWGHAIRRWPLNAHGGGAFRSSHKLFSNTPPQGREVRPIMDWDDYFRQQAAMYRQLAQKTEDTLIKQELLDWQVSARRSPITSRIVGCQSGVCARKSSASLRVSGGIPPRQGVQALLMRVSVMLLASHVNPCPH
jgi:hypothetical protein